MVEMCLNNDTAMMQVRNLFISDPGCWADTRWVALEQQFTQERVSQVQANLIYWENSVLIWPMKLLNR